MAGSAGTKATTLDAKVDELIGELEANISDFEANQLPQYNGWKELHGRLTGTAPAPAPAPARPARRQRAARQGANGDGGEGSKTRSDLALEIIGKNPGIMIPAIAEAMGIEPNYLYRIVPTLHRQGQVTKDENGGWHPASALSPDAGRVAELEAASKA